ncbi:MAG: gliding motility-associated C-terminal domain-containing protein [Bacteroidota bacterium]|nr:gliding motility-associated C-terminal domain-containing protein [Bacteroidota bacterium]
MRKLTVFVSCLMVASSIAAQNFSNKGKDFWLGYGYHVNMAGNPAGGGTQDMILYFTSDKNANVTVEIPANGYKQTYAVAANQVTLTNPIPKTGSTDARVYDTGYYNRGIHIYSDVDIVAYAHIYNSAISGASLLFPTNTLGNDYYVISYNQASNANLANSFAFVVAVEDNTTVEITPSVSNKNGRNPGSPFTVNLNKGQIYNLMGTTTGTKGTDLTGTHIRTISSSGTCKQIAVFCGSGKISIGGTNNNNNQTGSADNLFAQAMPASAWGLKYLTSPTGSQPSNYYRICVKDPQTIVKVNGAVIPNTYLQNGFFYELKNSTPLTTPGNGINISNTSGGVWNLIEADKPINVAQYCTTQGMDGNPLNTSPLPGGDPEMIYLSPVEQTINNITLYSATKYQIIQSYINVIIKNGGVKSFTLDGVSKASSFTTHPQEPNYSYAIFTVSSGSHTLYSDTGFNSIAYGFGQAESYGYNAGTNIKNLYAPVFQNPYARISFAATCVGTPFQFSVPLSYQPSTVTWDFGNNPILSPNTNIGPVTPVVDSTSIIGGQTLYFYSPANGGASKTFTISSLGTDTIKLFATNPSPDGCSSSNAEYDIPVIINPVPTANYSINTIRCISDSIKFTDATTNLGTSKVVNGLWYWDDGTKDSLMNPLHKFGSPKIYNIRYRPITDFGCIGDTTIPFNISASPIAKFVVSDTTCINKTISFTDSSTIAFGTIVKRYWDYGNGIKDTLTAASSRTQTYTASGTYTVSLIVENDNGCKSNTFSQTITVHVLPVANFSLPIVCMPLGAAQFYDSSTITDGTQNNFKYRWSFGDGGMDSVKNPLHNYAAATPVTVKLSVASQYGCVKDSSKIVSTFYLQPKANFTVSNAVCLRDSTTYSDGSDGKGSSVVKWRWNFGDGSTDTLQNTKHLYAASNIDTVRLFIYTDKGCMSDTAVKTTTVNPLPLAGFYTQATNNYCEKRPIQFIDTAKNISIDTASLRRWYWDMGNGTIVTPAGGFNSSFNQYYDTFKVYTVKMMVENSLGCKSDTVKKSINIHAQPLVGFTLPEVCLADALANFSDTTTIPDGSAEASYLWNYNAGSPAISPSPTISNSTGKNGSTHYNAVGNYQVSYKVTTSFGCDSVLAKPFTVNGSIPHANFVVLNDTKLCGNDSIRIYDSSYVNFGTVTKNDIYWNYISPSPADSIDNDPYFKKTYSHIYPNFQWPSSLTYSIKMIAHSGNSSVCSDSITKVVTIHQSPKVQFNTLPGICNDTTARQITQAGESSNPTVPGTFTYVGVGVNSTGLFTPKNVAAGTYPVKYVYTTAFSCADSATINITVWPSPQAKWGVNLSPLCEKNDIVFNDSSVANYSNIVQRIWDFGDATNAVYTNTVSFKKQYAVGNTYAASLRVITDSGCRSTFNIQNLKINYLPLVSFTLPGICLPDGNGTFTSTSTIKDGTDALFSYLWNFGDPNDATSATSKIAKHKYSALGPVNVQLKITSISGCIDSLAQQLNTIYPQPKAAFTATPNQVCINSSIQFTDNSNGITSPTVSWHWDLANGNISTQTNPVKQFSDSGTFNIALYIYNQQGCVSDTAVQQVIVNPYPKLNMGADLVVLQGGVIAIKPSYYGTDLMFKWTPSNYLNSDTAANPLASPPDDIRYYLSLTGIGGCSVSDSIFITVLKSPVIPNIFSPNGDGINDTWQIKYLDSYPGATVDVFNRYGQPVFHSNGYNIPWDGTFNGNPLPIGTYYYIINPKNNRPIYNGSITIIR